MVTREECISILMRHSKIWRTTLDNYPGAAPSKRDEWKKRVDAFEMAAKIVAKEGITYDRDH